MVKNVTRCSITFALCVATLLASTFAAEAALVEPIYQVNGFDNFGPVIGGPLVADFGSGFPECVGTLTSTVREADIPLDLDDDLIPDILPGDLTFIYRLDAGSWSPPFTNVLDYLQVHLPLSIANLPLAATGYNTTVSDVPLTRVNTEIEANYQIEFGDDAGGSLYAFGLGEGETLEMFVTFRDATSVFETDSLVDGGGLPTGGIPTLGPIVPEPASVLLALGGVALAVGAIKRRR